MSKKEIKSDKEVDERAWPLASSDLTLSILDLVREAKGSLKKGANEVTKSLNRGTAKLVILTADTDPLEILLHLPLLCEDKNVTYVFVRSAQSLGRACGISRNVISASILEDKRNQLLKKKTDALVDEIQRIMT